MHYRSRTSPGRSMQFVLSDGSLDRHGTRINPNGWDLSNFDSDRNPIALFGHDSSFIIGSWKNVRVENDQLVGTLNLAEEDTSPRVNEIRSLVRQGILRGVSVGFSVNKPGKPGHSEFDFEEQELIEASLVAVPSNPNTLAMARSLNVSPETMSLAFGEQAERREIKTNGGHAETSPGKKAGTMAQIAQRIEFAEARVTALKDELTTHLDAMGDEPDDADTVRTEDLNKQIAGAERALGTLKDAEAKLGNGSEPITIDLEQKRAGKPAVAPQPPPERRRAWAQPVKPVEVQDYYLRAATCAALAYVTRSPMPEIVQRYYPQADEETRQALARIVTRAATVPATTFTTGWAIELVETSFGAYLDSLQPEAVYPRLAAMGERYTFGRAGKITIPSRATTPTIAGSFVLEGSPIPVRQAAFTSQTLTPKKMAVISVMTREITEHSTPQIEQLVRRIIVEDTAGAIDNVLLDATAADTTRPAGIRAGVAGQTPTAGGGIAAVVGDIKNLVGVLTNANSLRRPVWIMHPAQALSLQLIQNAGGDFAFKDEIQSGRLFGYPVITSTKVTPTMVIFMDAADFASVNGDDPRFDVSDQATVHMEDTTPLAIGTVGTPTVVAAPTRSLWQTDCIGIRMILPMNWALLRTGTLSWVTGVTW